MLMAKPTIQATACQTLALSSGHDRDQASRNPTKGQESMPLPEEKVAAVARARQMLSLGQGRSDERATSMPATIQAMGMTLTIPMPHNQFSNCNGVKIRMLQPSQRRMDLYSAPGGGSGKSSPAAPRQRIRMPSEVRQ